jgi:hypothetical protein
MLTADASAPERAPVRGHPPRFRFIPSCVRGIGLADAAQVFRLAVTRVASGFSRTLRIESNVIAPGSCPRTAHSGAQRKAMLTAGARSRSAAPLSTHLILRQWWHSVPNQYRYRTKRCTSCCQVRGFCIPRKEVLRTPPAYRWQRRRGGLMDQERGKRQCYLRQETPIRPTQCALGSHQPVAEERPLVSCNATSR